MRNKRNRKDWPQRVFNFAIDGFIHPLVEGEQSRAREKAPQVVFDAGLELKRLWNLCVENANCLREEAKGKSKEEASEVYARFYPEVYPKMAESWLPSTFYKWLFKGFMNAQEQFIRAKRGAPKFHGRFEKITLPHVDAAGGKDVAYLAELRDAKPYHLRGDLTARGKYFRRGFITINEQRVEFDCVTHEPIPAEAKVKIFALVGKKVSPFGWKWSLQITIETPSPPPAIINISKWLAIDFGWRRHYGETESGLRLAYTLDYRGEHGPWILPFKCANNHARRRAEFIQGFDDPNPEIIDWRDYWERQSKADLYLEDIKAQLREIDRAAWPPEAQRMMGGIIKMRGGGLMRLLRILDVEAPACLKDWAEKSTLEFRRLRGPKLRMLGYRDWLYRNWARQMAEKYDVLRYEGDLSFKNLAEAEDQNLVLKASQKYRQEMAAPHYLRNYIVYAFLKWGKQMVPLQSAGTTAICSICGANVERRPALLLTCSNGHQQDQDFNAVQNLAKPDWPEVRARGLAKAAG